jgi:hypothetical protein
VFTVNLTLAVRLEVRLIEVRLKECRLYVGTQEKGLSSWRGSGMAPFGSRTREREGSVHAYKSSPLCAKYFCCGYRRLLLQALRVIHRSGWPVTHRTAQGKHRRTTTPRRAPRAPARQNHFIQAILQNDKTMHSMCAHTTSRLLYVAVGGQGYP